jgi:hypothetical protein
MSGATESRGPSLIPSLVRTGNPLPDNLPVGFAQDLPGHAELRLIVSRRTPVGSVEVDDAVLLEFAGHLWARARLGGKPSFLRFARSKLRWSDGKYSGPALSKERAETLWQVAVQRRREAVAAFDAFVREMNRLWTEALR